MAKLYRLQLKAEPAWLNNRLLFLGEIPELTDFEERHVTGESYVDGRAVPDRDIDDTAIAYMGTKGLFIITGCSHAGICNIIEYARRLTGESRVVGVIGGFHLFNVDERLRKTIEYLASLNIQSLNPCHCVSLAAKAEMMKRLNITETGVGMEIYVE